MIVADCSAYWGHRGHDLQLPIQSVPITSTVLRSKPAHGEVYSIQPNVKKFASYLWQMGRWFSPGTPVSLTNKTVRHDITELILLKHHNRTHKNILKTTRTRKVVRSFQWLFRFCFLFCFVFCFLFSCCCFSFGGEGGGDLCSSTPTLIQQPTKIYWKRPELAR